VCRNNFGSKSEFNLVPGCLGRGAPRCNAVRYGVTAETVNGALDTKRVQKHSRRPPRLATMLSAHGTGAGAPISQPFVGAASEPALAHSRAHGKRSFPLRCSNTLSQPWCQSQRSYQLCEGGPTAQQPVVSCHQMTRARFCQYEIKTVVDRLTQVERDRKRPIGKRQRRDEFVEARSGLRDRSRTALLSIARSQFP
jgi:hypothetical protein